MAHNGHATSVTAIFTCEQLHAVYLNFKLFTYKRLDVKMFPSLSGMV